jgi:hypothetical protein
LASLLFCTVETFALALRTFGWPPGTERQLPLMLTITAPESTLFSHLNDSSFNSQGHALYQCLSYFSSCQFDNPPKGSPRDTHLFGRLLVVETFHIHQSHGLHFIHGDHNFLEGSSGNASRREIGVLWRLADSSALFWSWHLYSLLAAIMRIWALWSMASLARFSRINIVVACNSLPSLLTVLSSFADVVRRRAHGYHAK